MTSPNLEKLLKYLKFQENLRSENYLRTKEYFDMFSSTPKFSPHGQKKKGKRKEIIEQTQTLFYLKGISGKIFVYW